MLLTCTRLILKNVEPYKEVNIALNEQPLIIIVGRNHDSKVSSRQNNGSGKSVLYGAIANCLYSAAPSSVNKNTKRDMLSETSSRIGFGFTTPEGADIQIMQTPSKWLIKENGVELKSHGNKEQKNKIQELFPITEDEFYAYTYLSSLNGGRLHFQYRRPADRLKFITDVFRLDYFDKMKKYFTTQLGKVKEAEIKYNIVNEKMLQTAKALGDLQWDASRVGELEALNERCEKLNVGITELHEEKSDIDVEVSTGKSKLRAAKQMAELHKVLGSETAESIRTKGKAATAYRQYVVDMKNYEDLCDELRAEIKEEKKNIDKTLAKKFFTEDALHEEAQRCNDKMAEISDHNQRIEARKESNAEIESEIEEVRKFLNKTNAPKKLKDVTDEIGECKSILRLRDLHTGKDQKCPTCMSVVDMKRIRKAVASAESKLETLRVAQKQYEQAQRLTELRTRLKPITGKLIDDSEVTALRARTRTIGKHAQAVRAIESLTKRLNAQKAPVVVPSNDYDVKELEDLYDKARTYKDLVAEHGELDIKRINKKLKTLEAEKANIEETLTKRRNILRKIDGLRIELEQKQAKFTLLMENYSELCKDVDATRPLVEKRNLYKALEHAWSAKGMKVDTANDIVRLIEENLNKYRHLLYPEPFEFKLFVDGAGVHCEVNRKNKPKSKATDVRLLSGAESDSFKLLWMVSTLMLQHPSRRTNLVVLDEPDAHMDSAWRELFAKNFMPFLRELVLNVVLITPGDPHIYDDAVIWTIEKKGGVSKVIT